MARNWHPSYLSQGRPSRSISGHGSDPLPGLVLPPEFWPSWTALPGTASQPGPGVCRCLPPDQNASWGQPGAKSSPWSFSRNRQIAGIGWNPRWLPPLGVTSRPGAGPVLGPGRGLRSPPPRPGPAGVTRGQGPGEGGGLSLGGGRLKNPKPWHPGQRDFRRGAPKISGSGTMKRLHCANACPRFRHAQIQPQRSRRHAWQKRWEGRWALQGSHRDLRTNEGLVGQCRRCAPTQETQDQLCRNLL